MLEDDNPSLPQNPEDTDNMPVETSEDDNFLVKEEDQQESKENVTSGNQQEILAALSRFNISKDDLLIDRSSDTPEIRQLKHKLRAMLAHQESKRKKKKDHRNPFNYYKQAAFKRKEIEDEIRRYMNFDHNRDKDGRLNSLGERAGARSTYEKPIARAAARTAAAVVLTKIAADKITKGFKNAIQNQLNPVKNQVREDIRLHLEEVQLSNQMTPDPTPNSHQARLLKEREKENQIMR